MKNKKPYFVSLFLMMIILLFAAQFAGCSNTLRISSLFTNSSSIAQPDNNGNINEGSINEQNAIDRLLFVMYSSLTSRINGGGTTNESGQANYSSESSSGNTNLSHIDFGLVSVDTERSEISFSAKVGKNSGNVLHLVFLEGYPWLLDTAAMVSEARLSDLQKAFALLDWELWDALWQGIYTEESDKIGTYILLEEYDAGKSQNRVSYGFADARPASDFVYSEDALHVGDFMFLGDPYFDPIALNSTELVDCTLCPILPLEQEALSSRFVQESGARGYYLNSGALPSVGSRVTVIIRLQQ